MSQLKDQLVLVKLSVVQSFYRCEFCLKNQKNQRTTRTREPQEPENHENQKNQKNQITTRTRRPREPREQEEPQESEEPENQKNQRTTRTRRTREPREPEEPENHGDHEDHENQRTRRTAEKKTESGEDFMWQTLISKMWRQLWLLHWYTSTITITKNKQTVIGYYASLFKRSCWIGLFRVSPSLCFKTRLSAQRLKWKWFFIEFISTRKIVHLASFWNWVYLELGNGLT